MALALSAKAVALSVGECHRSVWMIRVVTRFLDSLEEFPRFHNFFALGKHFASLLVSLHSILSVTSYL